MGAAARPLTVLVGALLAAGAAWMLLPSGRSSAPDAVPAGDWPAGTASPATDIPLAGLAASGMHETTAQGEAAPRGPVPLAEARKILATKEKRERRGMLGALGSRGCDSQDVVADLERFLAPGGDPYESMLAMAAIMKVEGSRRFLLDLALLAGKSGGNTAIPPYLLAVDPVVGLALVRAAKQLEFRDDNWRQSPIAGIGEVLEALAKDAVEGTAAATARLDAARGREVHTWAYIVAGLRPLPPDADRIFAARLASGTAAERIAVLMALADEGVRWLDTLPATGAQLFRMLPDSPHEEWSWVLAAIGSLGTVETPEALQLIDYAKRGGEKARLALRALERLGPGAAGAASALVAAAPHFGANQRASVSMALAAMRTDEAIAYARERLRDGTSDERRVWLMAAQDLTLGRELIASIRDVARRAEGKEANWAEGKEASWAVNVIAHLDPSLALPETRSAVRSALEDSRMALQEAGLAAVQPLARSKGSIPADLRGAVIHVLARAEYRVARYAALALSKLKDPTTAEWLMVTALNGNEFAESVLAAPAWKAVGDAIRAADAVPAAR